MVAYAKNELVAVFIPRLARKMGTESFDGICRELKEVAFVNLVHAITLHDADILTYTWDLLANWVTPLLRPSLEFDFAKAYYARFSSTPYGRVTRLFIWPLLQALGDVVGRRAPT
ncbi:MAG: hypothetical protein ACUVRQ_01240, partial [Thermoanaerobaculaceae bacterium]